MIRFTRQALPNLLNKRAIRTIGVLALLAIGLFSSAIGLSAAAPQQLPLALDGSNTGACINNTSSCATTLTTVHGNDIIIAFAGEDLDVQTSCTFHISDTTGLSWSARSTVLFDVTRRTQLQEFWAKSTSPLSSDQITESISGCGNNYNSVMVIGISGANVNNPFDPNTSLPAGALGTSANTSVSISTSNPTDMIYAAVAHGNNCCPVTAGPGFTMATQQDVHDTEYRIVNSTVTNFPVTFNDTVSDNWITMADAVQSGSGTPLPPSFTIQTNNLITVTAGNDLTQSVTVYAVGNFTGTVNLTSAVFPTTANGPTLRLNSTQVNVPFASFGSTYLSVITNLNTTAGGYNFTISGSAVFGGKTIQQTFFGNIIVQAPPQPDFFINAYPTAFTVLAGSSASSGINVSPAQPITNSFTVTLTAQLPVVKGLTATLNPSAVTFSFNSSYGFSTLTINTLSTTPAGNYSFTVTGRSGTISHSVLFSLQVKPPPTITLSPKSGPVGTEVVVRGTGFPASQFGPTEILVSFDDQLVGFTFTSDGTFNFTFNVPVSQAGISHLVKATDSVFTGSSTSLIVATAPFLVTSPTALSTSLTVGTIYFPGDKAVAMIQVTSSGLPVSSTALQLTVTLTAPDNSKILLNVTSLGSGLFKATYTLSKTATIGTYSLQAVAHLTGAADGSAIGSFEVKLPWLSSGATAAITTGGVATVGALGVALVSWRVSVSRRSSKKPF